MYISSQYRQFSANEKQTKQYNIIILKAFQCIIETWETKQKLKKKNHSNI